MEIELSNEDAAVNIPDRIEVIWEVTDDSEYKNAAPVGKH